MENLRDKCRGSLIGGAIGDAFGYPVEFVGSFDEIFDKALFSDDTQMTLYTAEGLLEAERSGKPMVRMICNAYLAWFGHQVSMKVKIGYNSELAGIDELNQRRAPGNTCLSALFSIYRGEEPVNSSKGCGRCSGIDSFASSQHIFIGRIGSNCSAMCFNRRGNR